VKAHAFGFRVPANAPECRKRFPISISPRDLRTSIRSAGFERQADAWAARVSGLPSPRSLSVASAEPPQLGVGRPLPPQTRANMEASFGHNFANVRVHADRAANDATRKLGALAFTRDNDIAFRAGHFDPSTREGRNLLGHELAHVVQQRTEADAPPVQARVPDNDAHFPCRTIPATGTNPGRAGRMSTADLNARETQAGALATQGAAALRATPLSETTRGLVWQWFHLDYNDPRIRCRQVATIADRFERVARDIRDSDNTYRCTMTGEPEGDCAGNFAWTWAGLTRHISLCSAFWGQAFDEQAATLMHEWMHYDFIRRGLRDQPTGGFDNAACYAAFASEVVSGAADPVNAGLCTSNTDPLPARDDTRINLPCPRSTYLTLSASGGYLGGGLRGGGGRRLLGFGLDLNFPLTRMHDWELTVGARLGSLRPTTPEQETALTLGLRVGTQFRYRPWRFGFQVGGHVEAGGLFSRGTAGEKTDPYAIGGLSAGFNIHTSRNTALQIFGELGAGAGLDTSNDRLFGLFQAGIGLAFQLQ
jgi:hypothetical protein